ncbi:MAG TPA: septation protein SepH [Propionicimonas sp.]|nr:septation protein SepH [Propionicimonas sp.]
MTHQPQAPSAGSSVREPPQTTLEIEMDSALTPREIQARIRAGESVEEVARAAGMGLDWIEPFAAPVLAERVFISSQAQSHPVRRGSDTIAHRTLGEVVADRLVSRRVDVDTLTWDAWRLEGRRWVIRVDYDSGKAHREARFIYDAGSRFSVADNDDARWLLGLHSASHGPQPGRRRRDEEAEPTIGLNDDLALVRVVQPAVDEPADPNDTAPLNDLDAFADGDDAFAEGELTEVDGVYDIVPSSDSGLDLLYDMLSSFDEDSVQIYAGLIRHTDAPEPSPVLDETPVAEPEPAAEVAAAEPAPELTEPHQPALTELEETEPEPQPAPKPKRSKRAQVPSWDQIMFGSPKQR